MTQLATQTFLANTKVVIVMAQTITSAENTTLGVVRRDAVTAGGFASPLVETFDPETGSFTYTSFYDNLATGTAVVNAANAFTPPPTSATVTTV